MAPGPTDTLLPPQKTRQDGWLGRSLVRGFAMVVVALTFGLTLITGTEGTAAAGPLDDVGCYIVPEFQGRGPEQPGVGPEQLFGPMLTASQAAADAAAGPTSKAAFDDFTAEKGINWNDPDSYTLWESNGVRGAVWSTTTHYEQNEFRQYQGKNEDERRCNLTDSILTATAQIVFDLGRTMTSATIALRQTATDATPFLNIIRDLSDEIGVMSTEVWAVGIGIAVMCTGFWVMSKWGGRNQREIVSGVIWVIVAIVGVGFLLFPSSASDGDPNYIWVAESANETTHEFIEDLGDALLPQDGGEGPCALKDGAPDRGTRMLDCGIYETLVFDPWSQGQYGGAGSQPIPYKPVHEDDSDTLLDHQLPDGIDMRQAQIRAQSVSIDEAYGDTKWEAGSDEATETDPNTKHGQWNLIRQSLFENEPYHDDVYKFWKGEDGSSRIAAAFGGLIAAILVGIFVCATSLLTMIWNAVPVVLLVALPLVGTLSVFPPAQKFLRGWAQTWLKSTILGLLFGIAQMLALVMVGGVLSSSQSLGIKCLVMIVMVLALWKVIQAAREDAFTPNLGGDTSMYDGDRWTRDGIQGARSAGRRTRAVARSAPGRALGGATAGATVGTALGARGSLRNLRHRVQQGATDHEEKATQKIRDREGREPTPEELRQIRRRGGGIGAAKAVGGGFRDIAAGGVKGAGSGAAEGLRRPRRSSMVSGASGARRALESRDARAEERRSSRAVDRDGTASKQMSGRVNPSARVPKHDEPVRRPRRGGQPRN